MVDKQMKGYSISLVTREMQIKLKIIHSFYTHQIDIKLND